MPRSEQDNAFLKNVPLGTVEAFRDQVYTKAFVERNPSKFLSNGWIDVSELKEFISRTNGGPEVLPVRVKAEPVEMSIKEEELEDHSSHGASSNRPHGVRTRSFLENGHETIELLSDSEGSLADADIIPGLDDADGGAPSDVTLVDHPSAGESESEESDGYIPGSQDMASDDEIQLRPSDTQWLDADVTSRISDKPRRLNRQLLVDQVEYVTGLPSYWPVPRIKTAYVVDLSNSKYDVYDGDGNRLTVDALIKDKDQDSWRGGTGEGDSKHQEKGEKTNSI